LEDAVRLLVRLLSTLLGLAVAGAGILLALEVGWHWWRPAEAPLLLPWPSWRDRLGELDWTATGVRVTAGVLAGVGLLLLLVSTTARRRGVRLRDPASEVSVVTSPRALARMVGARVRAQDNVRSATVTATARRVRVRATSALETEQQLRPRLAEAVADLLNDLPLARRPKVSVVVDSPKDRRR
jgi:hypothetical protein